MTKVKVAVLISGSGSNLQALIDACIDENYPAEIALVISNNSNAYGLQRAKIAGIDNIVINQKYFKDRKEYDYALQAELEKHAIEFVCLAGFMRILTTEFVEKWQKRMLNIHPSLLPAFKGANAVADAFKYGVKIAGCTAHYVIPEVDAGEIIAQAAVSVVDDDTIETLQERILIEEHRIYQDALKIAINQLVT